MRFEYQNRIIQDENAIITDLVNAFTGSNLDHLAYRAVSEYVTVSRHRLRSPNAEMNIRKSFSLEKLDNIQPDDRMITYEKAFWDLIAGGSSEVRTYQEIICIGNCT